MVNKKILKKLDILYVEDKFQAAKKLSSILTKIFNNVYVASNGKKALDIYNDKAIDIIISDINMPIMDGLELSEIIRENNNDIPILLTTAKTETNCLIKAIELNIDNYILKPISLDDIIEKIYSLAEKLQNKENKALIEQYKEVIDLSSIVMKFDLDGRIVYVNNKYEEISEYTRDELIGKFFNFNAIKNTPPSKFLEIWETIKNKKTWKGKLYSISKKECTYIIDTTILPILDSNKNIKEYILASNDITSEESLNEILQIEVKSQKFNVEEKTHLLNEYRRSLEESSILIRLNNSFEIEYLNDKFLEIINYSKEELLNKNIFDFLKSFKNDCIDIITSLSEENFIQKVQKVETKENIIKYFDLSFSPIFSKKQEIQEYLIHGTDISEVINLYDEIEETQKDVIFSLGSIGEYRSKETGNHVKRVANYSYLLALKLGLGEKQANILKMASPMHDIGKVAIPDYILNKPGKLTDDEFTIMKTHASIGYEMLKKSNREILKASAVVAHEHHEKWDGSGYPRGLKGEDIHIFGRITAVADAFDALGSDRCYKKSWPLEDVLNYLKKKSGVHFDPDIVNIFFKNLDELLQIKNKYNDRFKG